MNKRWPIDFRTTKEVNFDLVHNLQDRYGLPYVVTAGAFFLSCLIGFLWARHLGNPLNVDFYNVIVCTAIIGVLDLGVLVWWLIVAIRWFRGMEPRPGFRAYEKMVRERIPDDEFKEIEARIQ
jgi:hypothetical protein